MYVRDDNQKEFNYRKIYGLNALVIAVFIPVVVVYGEIAVVIAVFITFKLIPKPFKLLCI